MPRGSCVATLFRRRSSKVPLYMLLLLLFQYPPATLSDSSIPRSSWERLRKAKKRSSPTNYTNTSNSTAFDTPLLGFLRNCVLLLVQQQQQHIMHHTIVKPSSSKIQNMAIKRMSVQISLEMNVTLFGKDFFDRIVRKRHCPDAGVFLNRRLEPLEGMDGGPASDRVQQKEKKPKQAVATAWILRWKTFSEALVIKILSQESVEAIKTIRSILDNVYDRHGAVDILGKYTTADIVASFIALSRLQSLAWKSQQRQQFTKLEPWDGGDARCSPILASSQHDFSSGGNQGNTNTDVESDNRALVQELAHYVVYANAAYGWSMDLATRQRVNIGGDTQTLLRQMNGWITRSDIVMAKWQSKAHRPAYFIVRDRKQKTVVLCIRGTWSARDLLTDLCCLPRDFESAVADDGCLMNDKNDATVLTRSFAKSTSAMFSRPRRHRGHMGMLEAARALQADCEATIAIELEKNPGYSLVLVGHSLGGGCAALLGTLWEQRHPTLRVYAFGPPCVAPANAQWHANIVSVVTDGDPFGRLSLGHIVDVTTALARLCEDPLLRNDILWRTNDDNGSAMSSSSSVLHPRATEEQHDLEDWCRRTMETTLRHSMTAEKLYPPGRVLLVSVAKAARAKVTMHPGQWWNWWMRREMPLPAPFSYPLRRHHPTAVVTLREVSAVEHFRELILFRRPGMMMMMDLTRHIPAHYISALTALAAVTPGCAAASFPASSAL